MIAARFFTILLLALCLRAEEPRIWIDAKVNGAPVRMFLDTGATEFYLFRSTAEHLGLRMPNRKSDDPWDLYFAKDKCDCEAPGLHRRLRPVIVEAPAFINVTNIDGFIGWKQLRDNIVRIDAAAQRIEILESMPDDLKRWTRLKLKSIKPSGGRIGALAVRLPGHGVIVIDTGQVSGVGLPDDAWAEWKAAHSQARVGKVKFVMPSQGVVEVETSFAESVDLGPIHLTRAPVQQSEGWSKSIAKKRFVATLGLEALARIDLIVDGKRNLAYIRPKQ